MWLNALAGGGAERNLLALGGDLAARGHTVQLVLAELVANAIDQRPAQPIHVSVEVSDAAVLLTVRNESTGAAPPDPSEWATTEQLSDRGRGLRIVDRLTDGAWTSTDAGWTEVRCRLLRPTA